jgi:hypothetical protein
MQIRARSPQPATMKTLTGYGLSGLAVLVLLFDAIVKLIDVSALQDCLARLGYALSVDRMAGIIELACLGLYLAPRTSAFGERLLNSLFGEIMDAGARQRSVRE